jgi:hypothetical protein
MAGTWHETTVSEPIQQDINTIETIKHTELLLDPAPEVFPATNAVPRVRGCSIQMLDDLLFFRIAQMSVIAALPSVYQSSQPI